MTIKTKIIFCLSFFLFENKLKNRKYMKFRNIPKPNVKVWETKKNIESVKKTDFLFFKNNNKQINEVKNNKTFNIVYLPPWRKKLSHNNGLKANINPAKKDKDFFLKSK